MSEQARWNTWTVVQPVQFEDEDASKPRHVRLSSPAARAGDPVRISDSKGGPEVEGVIVGNAHSVLKVRRTS